MEILKLGIELWFNNAIQDLATIFKLIDNWAYFCNIFESQLQWDLLSSTVTSFLIAVIIFVMPFFALWLLWAIIKAFFTYLSRN